MISSLVDPSPGWTQGIDVPLKTLDGHRHFRGKRVLGVLEDFDSQGVSKIRRKFQFSYTDGPKPKYELAFLIPNPGEPHLVDEWIIEEAVAHAGDGVNIQFHLKLVSRPPIFPRRSSARISQGRNDSSIRAAGELIAGPVFHDILQSIYCDWLGSPLAGVDSAMTFSHIKDDWRFYKSDLLKVDGISWVRSA